MVRPDEHKLQVRRLGGVLWAEEAPQEVHKTCTYPLTDAVGGAGSPSLRPAQPVPSLINSSTNTHLWDAEQVQARLAAKAGRDITSRLGVERKFIDTKGRLSSGENAGQTGRAASRPSYVDGGAEEIRTPDLIRAKDALSQLSHCPV